MHSFGSSLIALVIMGFCAITTLSAPFPWNHPEWSPTSTSSTSSSSSSSDGSTTSSVSKTSSSGSTTSSVSTTSSSGSGSDAVKPGTGTAGMATIVNKCGFPTYVYVCKQHPATCDSSTKIDATTGSYSEAYAPSSDGGHSLKISVTEGSSDILQFEYTNAGNGQVSYDLSEVNGNPFGAWGFSLTNTTTDVFCASPATNCPAIFTDPTNGIPYTATTSDGVGAILCG